MSHSKVKIGDRMTGRWRGHKRWYHVIGTVTSGSPNVYVNGKKAARLGDRGKHTKGKFTITTGRPDILINGKKSAFKGSKTNNHRGSGTIISGSKDIYIS